MENQKSSATSIMLNYGLILGVISVLLAVTNYTFGNIYQPHWSISIVSGAATILVIVFGLKQFKQSNNGLLNLGQALKTGLGIALISGLVYVIYFYIFVNFIEVDYFTNLATFQEATMIETYPNMSDEQLETSLEMAQKFSGFGMVAAIAMIMSLFFGFIVSLIAGLIMKKSEEID